MTDAAPSDNYKIRRFIAAYKLRLAERAATLRSRPETWGHNDIISIDEEKRFLATQDQYRIAPYPYPGLRSFDTDEGELFFGREPNVEALRQILTKRRLVVVLGGSGSGKSSLIRAGLLPFLNGEKRIPGRDGNWYAVEFRPRTDPFGELSAALVRQLLCPLLKLRRKGLLEALEVPANADFESESTIAALRDKLHQRFVEAKLQGRCKVLEKLLEIANDELDRYDNIATLGRRLAAPNLFLLVDQLEEVFRPEVADEQRKALLDLIVDLHKYMQTASAQGGLFLAATIRSEEVHRCAEHRGLSEVVIGSGYQIEILDPGNQEDALALRDAIIRPARNVLQDWGFADHIDHEDAPFEPGLPDLLLQGAARLSKELDHRPDQLPLLQHALQASWHAAMRRWSAPNFKGVKLEITRKDLPGQAEEWDVPDLSACLKVRADKAGSRAAERFAQHAGTTVEVGKSAIEAAFRALARRDDRGNWARRFAGRDEITAFLNADPKSEIAKLTDDRKWPAVEEALHVFQLRGYMSRGGEQKYDISHEALIRNWPLFQEWLRAPQEVAYALGRVLMEVDPETFEASSGDNQSKLIPENLAERVEVVSPGGKLPTGWGEDQIAPYLLRPALRRVWGGDNAAALNQMITLARRANKVRRDAEHAKQKFEKRVFASKVVSIVVLGFCGLAGLGIVISGVIKRQEIELELMQAAAHSLIGRMQAETNWTEGLRERVAIHVPKMLRGEGKTPDEALVRQRAWQNWDTAVRAILGQELRVVGLKQPPDNLGKLACVTLSEDPDNSEASSPVNLTRGDSAQVRLLARLEQGASGVRFETSEHGSSWTKGDVIGMNAISGARVCLAPGGSALTASYPGAGLPFVSEIHWFYSCEVEVGAKCTNEWRAIPRPIKTVPVPAVQEVVPKSNCVRAIRKVPVSDKYSTITRMEIDFSGESETCESDVKGAASSAQSLYFRGTYVPGLAAAIPSRSDSKFKNCTSDGSGQIECPMGATESKLILRPAGPPQFWSMSASPTTEEFPIDSVLVIAPKIVEASIDNNKNIILGDDKGSRWIVINHREELIAELWRRTDRLHDTKWENAPPEVLMVMKKEEFEEKAPPQ
jgi:hypothetical protein